MCVWIFALVAHLLIAKRIRIEISEDAISRAIATTTDTAWKLVGDWRSGVAIDPFSAME